MPLGETRPLAVGEGAFVRAVGLSDIGRKRDHNEDSYSAICFKPRENPFGLSALAVVADGMGGHERGEEASAAAVGAVNRYFRSRRKAALPLRDAMSEAIAYADQEIAKIGGKGDRSPGTTLSVLVITGKRFYLGHVGDSRIYLLRRGKMFQLTKDHSYTAEAIEKGLMTPEQARTAANRSVLTQALGGQTPLTPQVETGEVEDGDIFVLCSDGLWDMVDDHEIVQRLQDSRSAEAACRKLVDLANERGGPDNITVAIVSCGEAAMAWRSVVGKRAVSADRDTPPPWAQRTLIGSRPQGKRLRRVPILLLVAAAFLGVGMGMIYKLVGESEQENLSAQDSSAAGEATPMPSKKNENGSELERAKTMSGREPVQYTEPIIQPVLDEKRQGLVIQVERPDYEITLHQPAARYKKSWSSPPLSVKFRNWQKSFEDLKAGSANIVFSNAKKTVPWNATEPDHKVKLFLGKWTVAYRPPEGDDIKLGTIKIVPVGRLAKPSNGISSPDQAAP